MKRGWTASTLACALLRAGGVEIDGIFYCPHHPGDGCSCRKPRTGLVDQAERELGFARDQLFVIGDKPCDIELGTAAGATTLLVRTGYGREVELAGTAQPDYIVDHLEHAAVVIAQQLNGRGQLCDGLWKEALVRSSPHRPCAGG